MFKCSEGCEYFECKDCFESDNCQKQLKDLGDALKHIEDTFSEKKAQSIGGWLIVEFPIHGMTVKY